MNKIFLCATSFLLSAIITFGQDKADTIYTFNKTIIAKVKEVGPQEISYTLPNEDVVYRMYKRAVLNISFSNGRKEFFNDKKD